MSAGASVAVGSRDVLPCGSDAVAHSSAAAAAAGTTVTAVAAVPTRAAPPDASLAQELADVKQRISALLPKIDSVEKRRDALRAQGDPDWRLDHVELKQLRETEALLLKKEEHLRDKEKQLCDERKRKELSLEQAARQTVSIGELLAALQGPGRASHPAPAAAAAPCAPDDPSSGLSAGLAAVHVSSPIDDTTVVRGRPSLTRHRAGLPASISAALFGSFLKFVNRQPQCDELVQELQDTFRKFKEQTKKPAPEYIRSLRLVFSGGAPGIGKTTWARLALDHFRPAHEEGPSLAPDFSKALDQCRERGWRYRISYGEPDTVMERELQDPGLSIAARWLWQHIKHSLPAVTYQRLWDVLEDRRWRFSCEDVFKHIGGTKSSLCLINLDEVNALQLDKSSPHPPHVRYLAQTLSSLLDLQRSGIGCVVPVLTATKALELEGVVVASGAQYHSIPLPLLADNFVHELVLDLHSRAAQACGKEAAASIPPLLRHLLALTAGSPRFIELLLFRLGRVDGKEEDEWAPSSFLHTWHQLEVDAASASTDVEPRWLAPVLKSALQRYSRFDSYLCEKACAAIVPELLYLSLFEHPVERTDSIGDCPIRVLEERGVVFLSPVGSTSSDSQSSAASGSAPRPRLRLVLPFLWLHRVCAHYESNHGNFVRVALLSSLRCFLSPSGFESLVVNVLALRCYFHAKSGRPGPDGRVRITTEQLLGVGAIAASSDGGKQLVSLPRFDSTCWRVLSLRHHIHKDNWGSFRAEPRDSKWLEPTESDTLRCEQLHPAFFLNGPQASFWDACALLEPPVFVQCKRSQLSLEREARSKEPSTFSWPEVWAEIQKCRIDTLPDRPLFVMSSDEAIARPAASATSMRLRTTHADAEQKAQRVTFLIDAHNQHCFFGSLLVTRKAMCLAS